MLHDVVDVCCTLLTTEKILLVGIHLVFLGKSTKGPKAKIAGRKRGTPH